MKKLSLSILIVVAVLLFSCSKGNDNSGMGDSFVYYDYYSDVNMVPFGQTNNNLSCKRVCYNITKDEVVWEKSNEYPMTPVYQYWNAAFAYSEAFLAGDYLVKIFSSADIPTLLGPANGVYFQKINKKTGVAEISKKIISTGEFNANDGFVISSVVTDGKNYFFACSNNYIYSYDENGTLRWKKPNYPMRNLWRYISPLGTGYSYIYYNDNKLYFISGDPAIPTSKRVYCLSTETGAQLWMNGARQNVWVKQLCFNDNMVFDVDESGYVSNINKTTGQYIETTEPPSGNFPAIAKPIGKVNNEFAAYFAPQGDLGLIEMAHPRTATLTYLNGVPYLASYILDNGKLYGMSNYGSPNNFEVYGIAPMNGVEWKKSFSRSTPPLTNYDYTVFDFKIFGNYIYLLAAFHIEGANAVTNEIRSVTPPGSTVPTKLTTPGLIVMSKSGSVVRQCKKLPVGQYETRVYNLLVE